MPYALASIWLLVVLPLASSSYWPSDERERVLANLLLNIVPSRASAHVIGRDSRLSLGLASRRTSLPVAAVKEIEQGDGVEKAIEEAGDSLMVIKYSASWCGPCKAIAPKYEELSNEYTDVHFHKMMAETQEHRTFLKTQNVRSLPTFHFWKNGKLVDSVSGAKADPLIAALDKNK
mmetsp:Transcript_83615/g.132159  ORF Transcript_83615/g.132159 Transcript_83615/m.132159 type:complete len:176 (+) Transcript_83615:43-570(+)|eukprot:CAMPEP_0169066012 /NCGR_PEP_ID=MMETSP1015-20121227/2721_1 /TAXON_ID=342587 /ORGANISM="Karlodinium micrum, Strain CCMP2283" /LENGTH=175 /DNA_ID=CAMNT_0009124647 /DNA_START=40 /DNA_END=567 /DNA_ORIENTATION=+